MIRVSRWEAFPPGEVGRGFKMNSRELAQEFTQLWDSLDTTEINTMLAKNVSVELLEFFVSYADEFLSAVSSDDSIEFRERLPNLLVIGYIIRILEERVH